MSGKVQDNMAINITLGKEMLKDPPRIEYPWNSALPCQKFRALQHPQLERSGCKHPKPLLCPARGLGADTLFFSNDWHYWTGAGTWALKKPMTPTHDSVSFFRRASDDDLRIKNPDGT